VPRSIRWWWFSELISVAPAERAEARPWQAVRPDAETKEHEADVEDNGTR
jgi:hypothetical protein